MFILFSHFILITLLLHQMRLSLTRAMLLLVVSGIYDAVINFNIPPPPLLPSSLIPGGGNEQIFLVGPRYKSRAHV